MVMPQSQQSIDQEWNNLDFQVLAHVFIDACKRVAKVPTDEEKALSRQVGLMIDARNLSDSDWCLLHSFNALSKRMKDDQYLNPEYTEPLLDVFKTFKDDTPTHEAAEACKDITLPAKKIKRIELAILF